MSSPIPGSSVRIASSLVSAGAADFVVPASEGVPTPPPDTYVRMSERDPRDKLGVVVEGGEGRKALGISWETASPLEKAGIVLVSSFIGIGILFGALQARRKSDIMGVWQLPDAPPDGKAEPPKLTPASLYDTSHMESYEGWVQQTIRAKWTSLKPEQQLAAVQDELKLTLGAASEIPSDPPSLWAIRLSRIVAESSSAGTGDLTTADGLLEHAMAIKSAGIELERLYLYQDAANMTAAAARAFEGLAGKQLEAVDAYRFVARNAEAAGDAAQAAFANREADRVWIRERLQQIFAVEKEIIGDADPKATAAAVALRIVEAPELAERFLRRDAPDKEGRFARPVLREQWRTVVTSVLKEIDAGLAPTWRSGIVDYLYGAEEPAYREYQKEWWYAELVQEDAEKIEKLVVPALDDTAFLERYVRDGAVTTEGILAVVEAERARIAALKPKPMPAGRLTTPSIEEDLPAEERPEEAEKAAKIAPFLRDLMKDKDARSALKLLSPGERRDFVAEEHSRWQGAGGKEPFVDFVRERLPVLRNKALAADAELKERGSGAKERGRKEKGRGPGTSKGAVK